MIKACDQCGYRKYLGDGKYMCTNAKIQKVLAKKGIIDMNRSKMLKRCTEQTAIASRAETGAIEPKQLKKYSAMDHIRQSPIADNQSKLF